MFSHNLPETTLPSLPHIPANSDSIPPLQISYLLNTPTQPSDSKKVGKWTPNEDELLRKYVALFSEKQWKKISEQIPGRTPIQCLHRWTKILKPGLVKGPWTPEEDRQLIAWVKKEGPGKWAQASSLIPGRSGKQCRERWFNNLNPEVKKGNWSLIEDELIFSLYQKYGSSWSKIAKYIPGRTENSIKNRFYSTLRKLAAAKSRTGLDSASPGHKDVEASVKGSKVPGNDGNKTESPEHEPNMLYGLLQEIACDEKQQEKKQGDEELNVKQEDGVDEVKKGEKVKIAKERAKKPVVEKETSKKEGQKETKKIDQIFNLNGDKLVLARDTNAPQHVIEGVAEKVMHTEIEENDTNFEHFVANTEIATPSDITRESSKPRAEPSFLGELDMLQKGIVDFCNYNVHDLMTVFKIAPSELSVPTLKQDIDSKGSVKTSPKNLIIKLDEDQTPKATPVQGLEGLSKHGFKRRQSQTPEMLHQGMCDLKPLTPISVKIPPLDTKENENNLNIGKLTPFEGRDLSENIHVFPKKNLPENSQIKLPGVLEQKSFNIQGINKMEVLRGKDEKKEVKPSDDLGILVSSINNTIGAATMMYSHYLTQINDTMKSVDTNDVDGVREKLSPLFQQLYGLESWLRNVKVDLMRLESLVQDQKNTDTKSIGEENKRKYSEEDLSGNKWDQILKKRKIE